ncbi:MAG: cytidine deaminase [Prevotellaceae bacterium]|jgi:cytidine deaminase|nr:cytidine deaminase [Prevotellaceae bacterium]
MNEFEINIKAKRYCSINELDEADRRLLEAANMATKTSYAPYSRFNVGSAVLLENGEIITGSNQENNAYPSGLCAERVAVFYANAKYPNVAIKAIAISSAVDNKINDSEVYPCGSCRQVLVESENRQDTKIKLIMGGAKSIIVIDSVSLMLPFTFDLDKMLDSKES